MVGRFGRIPLDRITVEWEDGHPINPRLLAGEVAMLLRTLAPADHPIHETYASAILSASSSGKSAITHGALADYFDSASLGSPAEKITASAGPIPAAAVLIWRQWINTLASEATKRAAMVAGFALSANDCASIVTVANASPVARQADQPLPPSGSEPGYVAMRKAQQLREGERSAAEQLDAERIARRRAERESAEKDAIIAANDARLRLALEEGESLCREAIEERRCRLLAEAEAKEERYGRLAAEEKLQDLAGLKTLLEKVAAWPSQDNKLDPRERATFERLLYALARKAGYKLEKLYADEDSIRLYADTIGAKVPEGKGSIAKKLEAAVARHGKDSKEAEEDR